MSAFFAYPSQPSDRAEIIETAVKLVNKRSDLVRVTSWAKMQQSSSRIIRNILDSIQASDFVISDISGLNSNVLFEAGYSFGNSKKAVLFSQGNSSHDRERDVRDLYILRGWTLHNYRNANDLATSVIESVSNRTDIQPEIYSYMGREQPEVLPSRAMFLKGFCQHEIAIKANRVLKMLFSDLVVDDWDENSNQMLNWYVKGVLSSRYICGVFVPDSWDNSRAMNSRFAFVCGMAVGMGKQVLMIGMPEFLAPFDYQDLLITPKNSEQAESLIRRSVAQLPDVPESQQISSSEQSSRESKAWLSPEDKKMVFLEINLGDTVAENEELDLSQYFVPTGPYRKALNARQAVVVGYKGTGKTASFFQVGAKLREHPQNVVCEIKPVDYNMSRFLKALRVLWEQEGEVGYTLDTVWKLVCYCEVLNILYTKVLDKADYLERTREETNLVDLVDRHSSLVMAPFEKRLEIMSDWLEETGYSNDNFTKQSHDRFLISAKALLIPILKSKNRVVILIDNLDKAWKADSDLTLQAQMVHSLLGIHHRLRTDLGIECDVSVIAFLRRNIYDYIVNDPSLIEPDKMITDTIELKWNDTEMLTRIIEKRFINAVGIDVDPWAEFFCAEVDGRPVQEWIYDHVLPRPRDLINFILKAMEWAFNRDHSEIVETDLKSALADYSGFALSQILAEYRAEHNWLSDMAYSFTGERSRWDLESILKHIQERNPDTDKSLLVLLEVGFLGLSINGDTPQYTETIHQARAIASKVKNRVSTDKMEFVVNPVFHAHLNMK